MAEPSIAATAVAELIVAESDLARSMAPDHQRDAFPAVLATARMVALMEIASARVLHGCLGPGEQSVGVLVDVAHIAPTPVGATVRATARYLGREGKLFLFDVVAEDAGGEVGRGTHKRAIISIERLENRAAVRNAQASSNGTTGQ
ncbi:MAG: thioesterase [Pirellulales bacterium]|nr:thioesterase [Pirellulales bacterium]